MEFTEVTEIPPKYLEVLQALAKTEREGFFPLQGSGQITLHYNEEGKLSKIVPSPWIDV